ncbi:MAG: DUF615 domain-containing protein [Burkholderiales bacterium]|nr:DUF615 domain-containing protein [Burkholderiales bacterium]
MIAAMDEADFTSKTKRKTAMLDLQALGEELISLPENRLAVLPLPENLLHAIHEAKRMNRHGALKRQRQYIGRLMRDIDPGPLREALDNWRRQSGATVAVQHLAERWRDRLIGGQEESTMFAEEFRAADLPRLRQLIRGARQEQAEGQPPRKYRELYRAILEILTQAAGRGGPEER